MKCYICNDNDLPPHSCYPFPRNPSRKKLWMKYCGMEVWNPTYRLCANHFIMKNFNNNGTLKKFAIPTVLLENLLQAPRPSRLANATMVSKAGSSKANQDSLKPRGDSDIDNETSLLEKVRLEFSPPPPSGLFEDVLSVIPLPITNSNETQDFLKSKHDSKTDEEIQQPILYNPPSPPLAAARDVEICSLPTMKNGGPSSSLEIPITSSEAIQGSSLTPKCDSDTNKNVQHIVCDLPSPFIAGGQHITLEKCSLSPKNNESIPSSVQLPQTGSSQANQDSLKSKGDSDIDNETSILKRVMSHLSPTSPWLYEGTSSSIQFDQTNSPVETHSNASKSSDDEKSSTDSYTNGSNTDLNVDGYNTDASNADEFNAEDYNADSNAADSNVADSDAADSDAADSDAADSDAADSDAADSDAADSDASDSDASDSDASDSDASDSNAADSNAADSDAADSDAADSNAGCFSADYSSTDDSVQDEENQYFAYELPRTPPGTLEGSSPPPEEEFIDSLNNDHALQATISSILAPEENLNIHTAIPNMVYYPPENLALRSIKLERSSPPPEEEYEDTLNSVQTLQATTSSSILTPGGNQSTHTGIPNMVYYPPENLALRSIKLERSSPPPEEEYEDTLNSVQNWQQINQQPQSCHINYYGCYKGVEFPASGVSKIKTEPVSPRQEPSYGSYIDEYGNYRNYENMESINQRMNIPESYTELKYEGNIGESYPKNQTVVAESEINNMAMVEPEIAELRTAESEMPEHLPMQTGPSSAVDANIEMYKEETQTLQRKLIIAQYANKQLKRQITTLGKSYKRLRQENKDLILELKTLKTSEPN